METIEAMETIEVLPSHYLDNLVLPPRDELWAAVREAHDYLYQWVNDPSSRVHSKYGMVRFNADTWGLHYYEDNECWVCLAGLRYLRRENKLLGEGTYEKDSRISSTDIFLDVLRDPLYNSEHIESWLGIHLPEGTIEGLLYNPDSEYDILAFLGCLLHQKDAQLHD